MHSWRTLTSKRRQKGGWSWLPLKLSSINVELCSQDFLETFIIPVLEFTNITISWHFSVLVLSFLFHMCVLYRCFLVLRCLLPFIRCSICSRSSVFPLPFLICPCPASLHLQFIPSLLLFVSKHERFILSSSDRSCVNPLCFSPLWF